MPRHHPAETIETEGVSVVLRRVEGPRARELFFHCAPRGADAASEAEAAYRAVLGLLEAEGGGFADVVCERVFLRDVEADRGAVRAARDRVLGAAADASHRPARTEIGQPPLREGARLEVAIEAFLPGDPSRRRVESVEASTSCPCDECARPHALRIDLGEELRLHAGALYGPGRDAYGQTHAMFGVAEELLQRAGMGFGDVVRTWIHLREMDRDYADLNRARREFFEARGIDPAPASTGIGGRPVPGEHDLCLGLYAVRGGSTPGRSVMTTPTLNEAPTYGSDFVRGMRVEEANRVALYVSGTASLDEAGRTVHVGDLDAQVDRMLVNVATLLEGQGAGFADVVSAITYLKTADDAPRLREKLAAAGFEGFPNALVEADVCRPELLCETEVLAVLPRTPRGT